MAWTDNETIRIEAIEEILNKLQTAVANLMSKEQMRQLLLIRQAEIDELKRRVDALELQLTVVQQSI